MKAPRFQSSIDLQPPDPAGCGAIPIDKQGCTVFYSADLGEVRSRVSDRLEERRVTS